MSIPAMVGTIERRLLINYRVDPDVLAQVVPEPFRPHLVNGVGLAGICLIRLGHLRPSGFPSWAGVTSENAAHRVAVKWDGPHGPEYGVYIPRRDTSSHLSALVGGRLFPGEHHRSHFSVTEGGGHYAVALESFDGITRVVVAAHEAVDLSGSSVFGSVAEASAFFEAAPLGYSASRHPGTYDGIDLRCPRWRVEPLAVDKVCSSFFEDPTLFPPGTIELDSALLMRDIPATWRARRPLEGDLARDNNSRSFWAGPRRHSRVRPQSQQGAASRATHHIFTPALTSRQGGHNSRDCPAILGASADQRLIRRYPPIANL